MAVPVRMRAMALEVHDLGKRFGGRAVVQNVSFRVDDGELVALLGPSGSGKSTILRMVAGLVGADAGRILVDGRDVTELPPQARDLGFVFQNYALFEHLTVAANVEFALRVRRVGRHDRRRRRDELLDLVGLGGSAGKYPSQLSGGQRQRTALARALAHRPGLLLLDEPFGALDARIRQELRQGLRELLKRIGTTAVFVTHDQEEAFSVADRIMVLHRGRLLEQGPADALYRAPRTEFVAGFVGRANLLPGELTPGGVRIRLDGAPARLDAAPQRVKVLLRPERLRVLSPTAETPRAAFVRDATVERTEYLGAFERVLLAVAGNEAGGTPRQYPLEALRPSAQAATLPLARGDNVTVAADELHPIVQPDLRLLVVAGEDSAGCQLLEAALAFGERSHALVTVLGGAVAAPALRERLEHYRQAFAGDLRLVEVAVHGAALLEAARLHLQGKSHDLVLLPANLHDPQVLLAFLGKTNVRQLLVAGTGADRLADAPGRRWSAYLRAFAASQPDLDLLSELAAASGTRVNVCDLAGGQPAGQPERWHGALAFRHVPFTIDRPARDDRAPPPLEGDDADVVVLDLGPRSALGERQRDWLRLLRGRWTWLVVQPDAADLRLHPASPFGLAMPPTPLPLDLSA
jgi:sulfate transport system ATP-binding protein